MPNAFDFIRAALNRYKLVGDLLVGWIVVVNVLLVVLACSAVVMIAGNVFDYVVVVCDISNELFRVDVVVINCGGERALKPILPGLPNVKIGR